MMPALPPTSFQNELKESQRWKVREVMPERQWFEGMKGLLLKNEFRDPEEMDVRVWLRLEALLRMSASEIPYYQRVLSDLNLNECALSELCQSRSLASFPILTKPLLKQHSEALKNHGAMMPGGRRSPEFVGMTKTSGTTGEPVEVIFTRTSARFFALLKQREYRWFRYDQQGLMTYIRPREDFPASRHDEKTQTSHLNHWPYVGRWFETGTALAYDHLHAVDEQVAWLSECGADYLVVESGMLESLALGQQVAGKKSVLKGIEAVATQLTPGMRSHAEQVFQLAVDENYGLNEIGLVAIRCQQGGRYHVHAEHCFVEIVDDEGRACKSGQVGRLLVTALNNVLMPLIRYDTDDMAEALDGACLCGRTSPSFGRIFGRYRRTAYLPGDTWRYWEKFRASMESMPVQVAAVLRQYQLYQFADESFEFRCVFANDEIAGFCEYAESAWQEATEGARAVPFAIRRVDVIPRGAGRKFQSFVSEFSPAPE